MKVLVMAAGAVGGYFGSVLAQGGNDVRFIARGENLLAIRERGLNVRSVTLGDFSIRAPVSDSVDGSWLPDLVLFCVKSYHNREAIRCIAPAVGPDTAILTLQNGIGSGDDLAAAFGAEKVMLGAAYVEAAHPAPGVFEEQGGTCRIVFAEPDNRKSSRSVSILETLRASGIDAEIADDIDRALWAKLVFICGLSGMTCVTRSSFAEVMNTPQTADLTLNVIQEAAAVTRALGVDLDADIVESTMESFRRDRDDLISSMHTDLEAGRPLELANLNGKVSALGSGLGVPTPANDFITVCLTPALNRAGSTLGERDRRFETRPYSLASQPPKLS